MPFAVLCQGPNVSHVRETFVHFPSFCVARGFYLCPWFCQGFILLWFYIIVLLVSRVRFFATQWTEAYQAPLSMGFSRQEHLSGLPLPSPMHESEKWKWSHSIVSGSSRPHGLQPTRLLCPWDFPGKSTGVGCHYKSWYKKPKKP